NNISTGKGTFDRDTGKCTRISRTNKIHKHRFDLIIAVMTKCQKIRLQTPHLFRKKTVALLTSRNLPSQPLFLLISENIERRSYKRNVPFITDRLHITEIFQRLRSSQLMIHGQSDEP